MGLFGRINKAGGIDRVARGANVGRAVITKMVRGDEVDAELASRVLDHLDAVENPTAKTNTKSLIAGEEARGRRAWS